MTATILYFLLLLPISFALLAKYIPELLDRGDIRVGSEVRENMQSLDSLQLNERQIQAMTDSLRTIGQMQTDTSNQVVTVPAQTESDQGNNKIIKTFNVLIKLLIISFLMGLIFNLPFKIYFSRKRKDKKIKPGLNNFIKKFLLKVPVLNAAILFVPYGGILIYMAFVFLFSNTYEEITERFYLQFYLISVLASLITLMFVYFWEKHRVHLKYIEHVYVFEELKKRIFKVKPGKIRSRMWTASAMTTLLPLLIVMFYLFISLTTLDDLNISQMNEDQSKIIFGRYVNLFSNIQSQQFDFLFYVNAFDSIMMFAGIFSGIIVAIIYILFFVNWTTTDIVQPVNELLANMERTGKGEMDQFTIVRTNDEIGVLGEGYNEMSQKIKDYITSISRINEANSRFVPKQFLEYLGKESIADINLGDQVQQEMTVLFCDIRNFTGISEEMTPKENFNFLNNYLGYMEPIIRKNHGFVDKYIGDSIMALFSERAEDALNAAIEMRIKLVEFNQVISQFDKPPIDNGFGIHTGNLMLGIVGGEGRMDGTVISDAVNLSSRLEGLTKLYGGSIIISEDTLIRINDPSHYNYRFLDIVRVKGKKEAVYIFEILDGEPEECKILKNDTKLDFAKALQLYKSKKFETALEIFLDIYSTNPNDKAAYVYLNRCKKFMKEGVPDTWDGIETLEDKFK